MLVQKCCDWTMEATTCIHFVEFSQSVLRLIPSVSIFEHRVSYSSTCICEQFDFLQRSPDRYNYSAVRSLTLA